jgi:hypothetical protein
MHNVFFEMPNALLLITLSILFISLSALGVVVVKRIVPNEMRYRDNPIVGNVSALLGVIYGVLVGLTALYLINNINATSEAVQKEANAVADLYRDMKWLEPTVRHDIKNQIILYLDNVTKVEWPLMKKDRTVDGTGDLIIEKISDILHQYKFNDLSKITVLRDILEDIRNLYDYRQQRIQTSLSTLNSEMWTVILIGTLLTVAINYFFEMHLFMHIITISAVAMMAASMIFLLITLDRPFKGDFVVEPTAFQSVLDFINTDKDP